ncbi:hypothetical protein [Janthinobacterium fluminis]|uniref:Uncharacterized protein n=1 Tax=Janthinobacterium fluminis TaxID=2987524 RepID=A0ABT5JUZ8_9BURK|nr:hypothetical protein [Janthinobacterium fluminis]MDC8756543.1 hypothetical protein [Janthinobacterium fluminis]
MADQEIAKHTKNVFSLVPHKEYSVWHKVREIAQEILIIVFAVTFSIWLYGAGEHYREQQQVKTFLLGVKRDLQSDLVRINEVIVHNRSVDANFRYLAALDTATPPTRGQLDAAIQQAYATLHFTPQLSRYDGFKSGGKLSNIEDDALLEKLVALYQHNVKLIDLSESAWNKLHDDFIAYIDAGTDAAGAGDPRQKLLAAPKGRRILSALQASQQRYDRYQAYADLGKQIIKDIELAYPGADARRAAAR